MSFFQDPSISLDYILDTETVSWQEIKALLEGSKVSVFILMYKAISVLEKWFKPLAFLRSTCTFIFSSLW